MEFKPRQVRAVADISTRACGWEWSVSAGNLAIELLRVNMNGSENVESRLAKLIIIPGYGMVHLVSIPSISSSLYWQGPALHVRSVIRTERATPIIHNTLMSIRFRHISRPIPTSHSHLPDVWLLLRDVRVGGARGSVF